MTTTDMIELGYVRTGIRSLCIFVSEGSSGLLKQIPPEIFSNQTPIGDCPPLIKEILNLHFVESVKVGNGDSSIAITMIEGISPLNHGCRQLIYTTVASALTGTSEWKEVPADTINHTIADRLYGQPEED